MILEMRVFVDPALLRVEVPELVLRPGKYTSETYPELEGISKEELRATLEDAAARADILRQQLVADYEAKFNNPYVAAARGLIDDVIEPRDTRRVLIRALELTLSKRERHLPKKHGIAPM